MNLANKFMVFHPNPFEIEMPGRSVKPVLGKIRKISADCYAIEVLEIDKRYKQYLKQGNKVIAESASADGSPNCPEWNPIKCFEGMKNAPKIDGK